MSTYFPRGTSDPSKDIFKILARSFTQTIALATVKTSHLNQPLFKPFLAVIKQVFHVDSFFATKR